MENGEARRRLVPGAGAGATASLSAVVQRVLPYVLLATMTAGCGGTGGAPTNTDGPPSAVEAGAATVLEANVGSVGSGAESGGTAKALVGTQSATRGSLAPDQLYARLAPAIAFVETPLGTGSGVLVAPGRVVTNAHVVWPFEVARVVFPDGSEHDAVPVAALDAMGDLAVLDTGAVDLTPSSGEPVTLADGAQLPIGSDLYLIGYPAETESRPQPAITRGILGRVRRLEAPDVAYLQTDADIAGGQSGGALVAGDGSVVGFSSMFLGESDLALAMSAPGAMARIAALLAGALTDGPAPRPIPLQGGERLQRITLAPAWEEAVFVLNPPVGTTVDLSADSQADVLLTVLGPYGDVELDADERTRGSEAGSVLVRDHGPHFVVVELDRPGTVTVKASVPLVPYRDPDDGTELVAGRRVAAAMDFPGDIDAFLVTLQPGEAVTLVVETVNLVPEITVEPNGLNGANGGQPIVDARLTGPLGLTLEATATADVGGEYVVYVRDADGGSTGGYWVRLEGGRSRGGVTVR